MDQEWAQESAKKLRDHISSGNRWNLHVEHVERSEGACIWRWATPENGKFRVFQVEGENGELLINYEVEEVCKTFAPKNRCQRS
jgi:hypothetical protein